MIGKKENLITKYQINKKVKGDIPALILMLMSKLNDGHESLLERFNKQEEIVEKLQNDMKDLESREEEYVDYYDNRFKHMSEKIKIIKNGVK